MMQNALVDQTAHERLGGDRLFGIAADLLPERIDLGKGCAGMCHG